MGVSCALLTAVGFQVDLILAPARALAASEIHALASPHENVRSAVSALEEACRTDGRTLTIRTVKDTYDTVQWYRGWQNLVAGCHVPATVNLTAGHGAAISSGCLAAIQHGLPTIIYDHLSRKCHGFSPRILLHLDDLVDTDRRILDHLKRGEDTVTGISDALAIELSTASRGLERLRDRGFCGQRQAGRSRVNFLAPGVAAVLSTQVRTTWP